MNKYFKKDNKLIVLEYENGIVLPQKIVDDGPMWGLGGVCDKNNTFVEESFYDGGWATHGGGYVWDEEDYVNDDVVYIGMYFSHWGHFLIDLSGRFWYLQQLAKERCDFKVAYLGDEEPAGNYLKFFNLLGIAESQLYHVKKPTRFKKVLLPQQSFKSCDWYTDEFSKMFEGIYEAVLRLNGDLSTVKDLEKVYFTRRSFSKAVYSEFGEEFFERIFNHNGYKSVAPETLTLEEQIYLWNNVKEIVCINGTIPLNVMFSFNENLKLTVLNKTSIFHENPYILLQMRGIKAEFIDVYKEPFKNYPKSLGEGPYLLNCTEPFTDYCKKSNIDLFIAEKSTKKYFNKMKIKYFFAILALGRRLKNTVRKIVPRKLVLMIKH